MILTEIRHYLRSHGRAALGEIALHCDSDPEAVRGMLELWLRKGRVRRCIPVGGGCASGCNRCPASGPEVYEWIPEPRDAAQEPSRD